jgi:multidrug resistance efflux pump
MRFQQSGFRPYDRDRDHSLLPPVKSRTARRLWRIPLRVTLFAIGAAILAVFALDRAWVRGNGIIAGELTAVSPIVQARLQKRFVNCLDHVTRGQVLAEFINEATVQFAAQQLQQLQQQLTQARSGIDIAEQQARAARKLVDAQDALWKQQIAILKAEDELWKHRYVAELVWLQAKAAVDRAEAETRAAEFVYETKKADQKKAEFDADILQKRIDSFTNSPELTGHFYLIAPKDGIVTQCTARPGEVIAARTPIYNIFNPDDTYAVVFFDPSDVAKLARGQSFRLNIGGIDKPVTGTITEFYPELSALPSSLTRYFWQREMWSQYVPVRLDFNNLDATQRSKLFAWAQVSASRWDGWNAAGATAAASVSWQWFQEHLNVAWQFVGASFAQQRKNR